jgi:molybdate transport system substrate-binding protein
LPPARLTILFLIPLLLAVLTACGPTEERAPEPLTIAAAASVRVALAEAAAAWSAESGREVRVTSGATGALAHQLRQGAPFALFAGADTETAESLAGEGHLAPETVAVYAASRVVIVTTEGGLAVLPEADAAGWLAEERRRVAIANPATAPYGRAARAFLEQSGVNTETLTLIHAPNVRGAWQMAETGNVEAAFVPAAFAAEAGLDLPEPPGGQTVRVVHGLGLAAEYAQDPAALSLHEFLTGRPGMEIMLRHGFELPPGVGFL